MPGVVVYCPLPKEAPESDRAVLISPGDVLIPILRKQDLFKFNDRFCKSVTQHSPTYLLFSRKLLHMLLASEILMAYFSRWLFMRKSSRRVLQTIGPVATKTSVSLPHAFCC